MKVKLYWLKNCNPCSALKKEIEKLPDLYIQPIQIEHDNISDNERKRIGITSYPTIAFFSDNGRILKISTGYQSLDDLIYTYNEAMRLEYIQRKLNVKNSNE